MGCWFLTFAFFNDKKKKGKICNDDKKLNLQQSQQLCSSPLEYMKESDNFCYFSHLPLNLEPDNQDQCVAPGAAGTEDCGSISHSMLKQLGF